MVPVSVHQVAAVSTAKQLQLAFCYICMLAVTVCLGRHVDWHQYASVGTATYAQHLMQSAHRATFNMHATVAAM